MRPFRMRPGLGFGQAPQTVSSPPSDPSGVTRWRGSPPCQGSILCSCCLRCSHTSCRPRHRLQYASPWSACRRTGDPRAASGWRGFHCPACGSRPPLSSLRASRNRSAPARRSLSSHTRPLPLTRRPRHRAPPSVSWNF